MSTKQILTLFAISWLCAGFRFSLFAAVIVVAIVIHQNISVRLCHNCGFSFFCFLYKTILLSFSPQHLKHAKHIHTYLRICGLFVINYWLFLEYFNKFICYYRNKTKTFSHAHTHTNTWRSPCKHTSAVAAAAPITTKPHKKRNASKTHLQPQQRKLTTDIIMNVLVI